MALLSSPSPLLTRMTLPCKSQEDAAAEAVFSKAYARAKADDHLEIEDDQFASVSASASASVNKPTSPVMPATPYCYEQDVTSTIIR